MVAIDNDKHQILGKMADQNKSSGDAPVTTNSRPVDDRDRHSKDRKRGNNGGREFGKGRGRGGNNQGSRQPRTTEKGRGEWRFVSEKPYVDFRLTK